MQTVKLELTLDKVQVVMDAISKLPWEVANPVIVEIECQVRPQILPPISEAEIPNEPASKES